MLYTYHKYPNPLVDENIQLLLNNPETFAAQVKVGEKLELEYFFEVKDPNGNLLGFIWFQFYSDENMVEISLGKSPNAEKFTGFAETVLSDLDKIKPELPQEWLKADSHWLGVVKKLNPKKEKLELLLVSNNFKSDGEGGFIRLLNEA
ncbi:hypothetical protein QSV37_16475 [Acinetobacter sp. VNK23]|uniref:hypothetical protein n=1 Tax=Acinetobacter thutiue TaxID=2998078 RepID=UPI002578A92B|nr:hypothetical protein [Acinetobacter thutiue]MDM1021875.1 hypothetical protein [Acinetobacter thutiue]